MAKDKVKMVILSNTDVTKLLVHVAVSLAAVHKVKGLDKVAMITSELVVTHEPDLPEVHEPVDI